MSMNELKEIVADLEAMNATPSAIEETILETTGVQIPEEMVQAIGKRWMARNINWNSHSTWSPARGSTPNQFSAPTSP